MQPTRRARLTGSGPTGGRDRTPERTRDPRPARACRAHLLHLRCRGVVHGARPAPLGRGPRRERDHGRSLRRPDDHQGRPRGRDPDRDPAPAAPARRAGSLTLRARVPRPGQLHAFARGQPAEGPAPRARAGRDRHRVRARLPSMQRARERSCGTAPGRRGAALPRVRDALLAKGSPPSDALPRSPAHDRDAAAPLRRPAPPRPAHHAAPGYGHLVADDLRSAVEQIVPVRGVPRGPRSTRLLPALRAANDEGRDPPVSRTKSRPSESGRQDLNG